ncbi:MAG: malate synthase A, partial [Caulobacteraceae bacterium]
IKKFRNRPGFALPERAQVTMTVPFMRAYTERLVRTCHHRGAHAMGGMAPFIPSRKNPEINAAALTKVRDDKLREVKDGFDGTWVAHPDLVPVAMEVFDRLMPSANQLGKLREDVSVGRADLLKVHEGERTEHGLRENIRVGVQYIEAWLRGRGAVPLYNLMEDAATAEISRGQIWQWIQAGAKLSDGRKVTPELFRTVLDEEMAALKVALAGAYERGRFAEAIRLFSDMSLSAEFAEFLTLPAYEVLEQR